MPASWTNDHIVSNLLRTGLSWSGSTITYGFPSTAPSWSAGAEGKGFSAATASQQEAARLTIGLWDDLTAPSFKETASHPQITVQNSTTGPSYAYTYYPGGSSASGSLWINPHYNSSSGTNDLITPKIGAWGFAAYIHELGHALGLSHPGNYNGGSPTYANDALYAQDSQMYTVMSYFDASNTGADWVASNGRHYYAQTPMIDDVLAIQALYGADMTTRAGNTHYGFNANFSSAIFDFNENAHPVLTIWDGGGKDTLDLSGFSSNARVDLSAGSFSDCDGMTENIAIAYSCAIENARGGSGNDSLTGNDLANVLRGLDGDDTILGGKGHDRLIGGNGADTLTGGGGDDLFTFQKLGDAGHAASHDVITDFVQGSDWISLAAIDAVTGGGDDAFHFGGEAAGSLIVSFTTGETIVKADVNGDGKADFEFSLTGHIALTAADFVL